MSTTAIPFTFDREALLKRARAEAAGYRSASPFPHAVLDDFLPEGLAEACAEEFPGPEAGWDVYTDQGNTRKLATADEALMGPLTRQLVAAFNGGAMIAFLEELTGIDGLVPDPGLLGGGLHQLNPGGFLKVHADFNRHPKLDLDRRINLLLYLNPGWREEWGGGLELWDSRMRACERYVNPIANRVVVFNTTSTSLHGNPRPVACPEGTARRSLAFYYYTNGRPEEERADAHSTLYQEPGRRPPGTSASGRTRHLARSLLPPALVSLARRARRTR